MSDFFNNNASQNLLHGLPQEMGIKSDIHSHETSSDSRPNAFNHVGTRGQRWPTQHGCVNVDEKVSYYDADGLP